MREALTGDSGVGVRHSDVVREKRVEVIGAVAECDAVAVLEACDPIASSYGNETMR